MATTNKFLMADDDQMADDDKEEENKQEEGIDKEIIVSQGLWD